MMGRTIVDDVESGRGAVPGLGWLPVDTVFRREKVTRQRRGRALGHRVSGYQIHHGQVSAGRGARTWLRLDDAYGTDDDGATTDGASPDGDGGPVLGTTLHGLFDEDGFRAGFLADVGRRRGRAFVPAGVSFAAARQAQIDRLADLLEAHLDLAAVEALIKEGDESHQ
jgi:adenosylcobyric acid synthase